MDDDVVDGRHDESDLGGVGGAGEVGVNLLLLGLVEGDKAVEDVVAGRGVVGTALVIREVVLHRAHGELLLETIDLVEEENDGSLHEPPRVADRVKQSQSFLHTINGLILEQQLIVLGNGDQEQDSGDILEAVNPLLPLRPLTTDVEHTVGQITDDKRRLGNTGGLDTRAKDILVGRQIIGLGDTVNGIEVAGTQGQWVDLPVQDLQRYSLFGRVVQLVFTRTLEAFLNTSVSPQGTDGITDLRGDAVTLDLSRLHEDGLHMVLVTRILQRQLQ